MANLRWLVPLRLQQGAGIAERTVWAGEKKPGYTGLCRWFTEWRNSTETAWLAGAPVHPLQQALRDLERAYSNFFARRAGFPRFNMKANIKIYLMNNKDDLINGTFCYKLFEEAIFDSELLIELIDMSNNFFKGKHSDHDVVRLLEWIIECVDQCFFSHSDHNDCYRIKNYSADIEKCWKEIWKKELTSLLK